LKLAAAEVAAAVVRNSAKFCQYNVVWGGFPQAKDSGC
jgi:hypothetical protein